MQCWRVPTVEELRARKFVLQKNTSPWQLNVKMTRRNWKHSSNEVSTGDQEAVDDDFGPDGDEIAEVSLPRITLDMLEDLQQHFRVFY
jgi:hypothetical protein